MLSHSHFAVFAAFVLLTSIPTENSLASAPLASSVDLDCRIDGLTPLCEGQSTTYSSAFAGTNYVWSFASNTAGASFCGPTNLQDVCVSTSQAGAFTLQLDYVLQSGPKFCTKDVVVDPLLAITELTGQSVCEGDDVVFSTSVIQGNGPHSYTWTFDSGSGPVVIPGEVTDTLVLTGVTLSSAGQYCVNVDGQCGPAQSCATLEVEVCGGGESHCTLTQGAYGSEGGTFNGLTTIQLLDQLLATDLVVGKPGRSLRLLAGSGWCVIDRLPANSGAATLPAIGDAVLTTPTCQTSPVALPLQNGRFKNILLGQTITLSLNTRLDTTLSDLGICEVMVTQLMNAGQDGLLGTPDDEPDAGKDGIFGTGDDVLTVNISPVVINALATLGLPITVGGLLELANRGLAAQPTGGASLGLINDAVDAINRGFDECRMLLECTNN